MFLVLVTLVFIGLFLWCFFKAHVDHLESQGLYSTERAKTRDVSCSQVCDINNPGAMVMCATGTGPEAKDACNIYYSCVNDCRAKQTQETQEPTRWGLPINPEEGGGSRYSHLMRD